jgi:hypothetical protein
MDFKRCREELRTLIDLDLTTSEGLVSVYFASAAARVLACVARTYLLPRPSVRLGRFFSLFASCIRKNLATPVVEAIIGAAFSYTGRCPVLLLTALSGP